MSLPFPFSVLTARLKEARRTLRTATAIKTLIAKATESGHQNRTKLDMTQGKDIWIMVLSRCFGAHLDGLKEATKSMFAEEASRHDIWL